jgi:hypothetical protein
VFQSNHPYMAQQETDALLLGQRVAWAIFAENEPYPKGAPRNNHHKTMTVSRQYATVRARAYQAGKGRIL